MTTTDDTAEESVDAFRARAAAWIPEHLPRTGAARGDDPVSRRLEADGRDPVDPVARARALQRSIWEGRFAGVCYPREYGGLGLTPAHMHAFNEECRGYDLSELSYFGMTFGMIGPTILDFGTEEQKREHIPAFLNGDNIWIQYLSEPTGGSDLAGVLTRAGQDGDEWVVNGSKIWTSFGDVGDYGLLVARTNWDVPKHRGISVFICSAHSPGIEVQPLRLVTGTTGFCQEFFTDVRVPAGNLLGAVDDGWTVASRLLVHERNSIGGGSQYWSAPGGDFVQLPQSATRDELVDLAEVHGSRADAATRQLVGEAHVLRTVGAQLAPRVATAMAQGVLPPPAGSLLKLFNSSAHVRRSDITMAIAGAGATVWALDDVASEGRGLGFLFRQAGSILSGTTEIQRNIISERVLGLPREPSLDAKLPFREVRTNRMPSGRSGN